MSGLTTFIIGSAGQGLDRILEKWLLKFLLFLAPFVVPVVVVLWHLPFAFIGAWMAVLGLKHKEPKTSVSGVAEKLEADIHVSASRRLKFSLHGAPRTYMIVGGILIAILDIGQNGTTALNYASDARRHVKTIKKSKVDLLMEELSPGQKAALRDMSLELSPEAKALLNAQKPQPPASNTSTPTPPTDQQRPSP